MIYWLLWGVAHILVRILYRVSYTGGSNVPRKGAVIVCANHLGWWDPMIFAIASRRRIYFLAKSELWDNWALGLLLWSVGAHPVHRGEPDRKAINWSLKMLEKGRVLGIFPEGTRDRTGAFRRAESGIGLFVARSGAPVVPGYVQGPYGFRKPVSLVIGKPIEIKVDPQQQKSGAERRQAAADAAMMAIAELAGRAKEYQQIKDSVGRRAGC